MNRDIHNNNPEKLNSFLEVLKENGFSISVQTYKDVHRLFYWPVNNEIQNQPEVLHYFAALVCKTEEQQDLFKILFENHFNNENSAPDKRSFPCKSCLKKIVFLTSCLGLAAFLIIWFLPLHKLILTPEKLFDKVNYAYQNENIPVPLDNLVANKKYFTDLQFESDYKQTDSTILFDKQGKFILNIRLKSKKANLDTTFYYTFYIAHQKHLDIQPDIENANKNQKITYQSPIDTTIDARHIWLIDEDTLAPIVSGNISTVSKTYNTSGVHDIKIKYTASKDTLVNQIPERFYSYDFQQKIEADYQLEITPTDKTNNAFSIKPLWIIAALLLTLILGIISYILYRIYKAKKQAFHKKTNPEIVDETYNGDLRPFDFPFKNKEKTIAVKGDLAKIAKELKKEIEGNIFALDISQTVQKTIKSLGLLHFVKKAKSQQRQYLFLINEEYSNSQQLKLFQYLVKRFLREQVLIDFYFYYQSANQFYRESGGTIYSVSKLQDMHYDANLIVISKGYELLEWDKPEIDKKLKTQLSFWDRRILVTPVSQIDWGQNETYLKSFFSIVPADIEGLMRLVQLLNDEILISQINKLPKQYESKYVDFYDIESLKAYLNHNERLFQWICALACLPRLEWNVILAIGELILEEGIAVTYSILLKIVRIDWIAKGSMTSNLRFDLLKSITVDNELKVRKKMLELFAEVPIDETQYSYEEKRVNEINNNFMLYASGENKDESTKKDHDLFLHRYGKEAIYDFSLLNYIKKDGDWLTPIKDKQGVSIGINEYISQSGKVGLPILKYLYASIIFCALACLPIVALMAAFSFKEALFKSKLNQYANIVEGLYTTPELVFLPNDCSNYLANTFSGNFVKLEEKDTTYVISLKDSATFMLSQSVPTLQLTGVLGNDTIHFNEPIVADKNYQISILGNNCTPPVPPGKDTSKAIYIQYFPMDFKDSAQKFRDYLSGKFKNVAEELDFKKPSPFINQVRYYHDEDKGKADSVANEASIYFKQKISAKKILSNPKHQIEVWLKNDNISKPDPRKIVEIEYNDASQKQFAFDLKKYLETIGYSIASISQIQVDANELLYYNASQTNEVKKLRQSILSQTKIKFPINGLGAGFKDVLTFKIRIKNHELPSPACQSFSLGNNYAIYFEAGKPTLSDTSIKVLRGLIDKLDSNKNLRITVNSYSNTGGYKMADQYGNAIKYHLDNKMVRLSDGLYKSYNRDSEDPNNKCLEKSLIIVQDFGSDNTLPQKVKIIDTIASDVKLGGENKYFIDYKKYGFSIKIEQKLNEADKFVTITYKIDRSDSKESGMNGATRIEIGKTATVFEKCNMRFIMFNTSIKDPGGKKVPSLHFDAIIEHSK